MTTPRYHRVARGNSGNAFRGGVTSLDGRKMSEKREPMIIEPGKNYTDCPHCHHEVLVINGLYSDARYGISEDGRVLTKHDPDGAAIRGGRRIPCQGSHAPAFNIRRK